MWECTHPQPLPVVDEKKFMETFKGSRRARINHLKPLFVEQCAICLNVYRHDEIVVSLKCHEAHIFHEECLNKWTENRLQCPMCRQRLEMHVVEDKIYEVGGDGKIIIPQEEILQL